LYKAALDSDENILLCAPTVSNSSKILFFWTLSYRR
jgi:hypothetical protein